MPKTKTIKPMNDSIPLYKRTQHIIMPPKNDVNIKPHEIFEGMKKVKKSSRKK